MLTNKQMKWHAAGPGTIWPSGDADCHVSRLMPNGNGGAYVDYVMDYGGIKFFTKEKAESKAKSMNRHELLIYSNHDNG